MIYLDNAATSPIYRDVQNAILFASENLYGNPSSAHLAGHKARAYIETARTNLMKHIHASHGVVIFTSGGSESNNLAINGYINYMTMQNHKSGILRSAVEHPSVINTISNSSAADTSAVITVDSECRIDTEELRKILATHKNIGLVTIQAVNNEVGAKQDIEEIGKICREFNVRFHTDAVQAIGHMDIDVDKCNIDMMSISGHKFGAPKGIGALYVRNLEWLTPIIHGGGQEFGLRSGTENVIGIGAMDMALSLINVEKDSKYYRDLRIVFLDALKSEMKIPYRINCPDTESSIVSLTIPHVESSLLVYSVSKKGLCISSGSACHSASLSPSNVLINMGMSIQDAVCTSRISFGKLNDRQEAVSAAKIIASCSNKIYDLWKNTSGRGDE